MQVARGGLALRNTFVHQIATAKIRLLKDHFHQLTCVDLVQTRAYVFGGVFGQRTDGGDLGRCPFGRFGHGLQHEEQAAKVPKLCLV